MPSAKPSAVPSVYPSAMPSAYPSAEPSVFASNMPSYPSAEPSAKPSEMRSNHPSEKSTSLPSATPSAFLKLKDSCGECSTEQKGGRGKGEETKPESNISLAGDAIVGLHNTDVTGTPAPTSNKHGNATTYLNNSNDTGRDNTNSKM